MEMKKKETEINKDMGIERFKTVKLWIKKACNSEETIRPYEIILRQFLEYCEENPDKIIQEWKEVRYNWTERQKFLDKWNETLEEYYALLDHTPLTKKQKISVVMSFFHHHKVPVEIEIQKYAYVKYHNRDITKEEIRKVLEHSGLRERTFDLMTLEGGFRPNTLAQLKYRDIREDFEANKVPMKIDVRPEILKIPLENRFTFIGVDGFNALKEYLSTRNLDDDDYIFEKKRNRYTKKKYPCPETFSTYFARLVKKLKLRDIETEYGKPKRIRFYCLRKYFRNNMKVEDTNFREFWMSHRFGSDEHYISLGVERHRGEYIKGYDNLRVYERNEGNIAKDQLEINKALQEQIKEDRKRIVELENLIKAIAKERNIKRIATYETDTPIEMETTKLVS